MGKGPAASKGAWRSAAPADLSALAPSGRACGPLVRCLLDAGVLTAEDIVNRGIEVLDRSRGHRLHIVRVGAKGGLVVKQAGDPSGLERLRREIRFYRLATQAPRLAAHLPASRLADSERGLLAVELVEPAETLFDRAGRAGLEPAALAALAAVLASCHGALDADALSELPSEPPWVLGVLEHDVGSRSKSARLRSVLERLPDRERVASGLLRARAAWRLEGLVHGDLKLDNCLLHDCPGGPKVVLVDWELAALGDPAWDLGSVVQECLLFAARAGASVDPASLARDTPVIGSFLAAYAESSAPPATLAERIALNAGARLLQAALEYATQDGPGAPRVSSMVELAARVLSEPAELAAALTGRRSPTALASRIR